MTFPPPDGDAPNTGGNTPAEGEGPPEKAGDDSGLRSYVRCDSTGPFSMSGNTSATLPQRRDLSAAEVNRTLNLNLGIPVDLTKSKTLRAVLRWVSDFFQRFEEVFFRAWANLPLVFRQKLTAIGWRVYYPLHKFLLGRRTGIHPDASHEYHALTTIMWWGRLFPVTLRRMRFSLSQLSVTHPPEAYPPCLKRGSSGGERGGTDRLDRMAIDPDAATVITRVRHDMGRSYRLARGILPSQLNGAGDGDVGSNSHHEGAVVTGYYVQHGRSPSKKVIFWLYGGAYLAGDSRGNINIAEKIGQRCHGADVFLPDYRLIPEHEFCDAHFDVVLAYEYLITARGVLPEDVVLLGVSSGGGLVTRLLQTIAERREEKGRSTDALLRNPAGGVLMCPFVDYTEPKGSFKEYIVHDLIVNQAVFEEGVPHFASLGSAENRRLQSPVHRSFRGLAPLTVVVSEHECCYDQTVLLVNRAREDGVDVTLGVWKYMCHVFPMLCMFLPEGREAIDFMVDWMRERLV